MRDGTEALDDGFQHLVANHECITTREQHVAHLRGACDVVDGGLNAVLRGFAVMLAGKTSARAVTAVHGTHVGDQEQYSVWVAVGEAWNGRILILVQRVKQIGG